MALLIRPIILFAAVLLAAPFACADPRGIRDGDGFPFFPGLPPGSSPGLGLTPGRGFDAPGDSDASGAPGRGALHRRGDATPPKPQTPAERAAAITKALAPRPPLAELRKRTLNELYVKLAAAGDEDEARGLAGLIGAIWLRTSSDTAGLLMTRAMAATEATNYPLALQLLDRLVLLQPDWAEAWNKRATVRYLAGDLDGSMADIDRVLKLEPRHFGALEGLATILQRTGFPKRALEVYRRALAIYPHQADVQKTMETLTLEVEGRGI